MEMLFFVLLLIFYVLQGCCNCLPQPFSPLSANNVSICCLLFFFNFFQYVKELFYPRANDLLIDLLPYFVRPFISGRGDGGE